jgi:glycosyltransferase involved in cell wall biosynthesis
MENDDCIRILHVLKGMNPGGIETWLMHVLRNIDRDRYRFDFLTSTTEKCAYDEEIRAMGCRIIPCLGPHNPLRYANNFMRCVRENGPYDVLHSHVHHYSGFVCMLGKITGIPSRVAHCHNDNKPKESCAGFKRKAYLKFMELLIKRYSTKGLACSGLAAEDLFDVNWQADPRWQMLYYGIDLKPFEQAVSKVDVRSELGFPENSLILGHVGRFAEQKNHAFLIDIIAEAVNKEPRCRALLVGDGPLRPSIQEKVHSLGLDEHVVFAGVRSDIPRLMRGAMDVFVFPSLHEGLPMVLIEAQAAGLPVVVSDVVTRESVAIGELMHFVSLKDNPLKWARTMLSTLPEARNSQGRAVDAIKNTAFSIEHSLYGLTRIYDSAASA